MITPKQLLCLIVFPAAYSANAAVYKCQDESGRTVFQEAPCEKGQQQGSIETSVTVAIDGPLRITKENLMGRWCFFQNEFTTRIEPESVTLDLKFNGQFDWSESRWQEHGDWSLTGGWLTLEGFGEHRVVRLTFNSMELERVSKMKLRRGGC